MSKIAFRTLTGQSQLLEPTRVTTATTQNKIERKQRTALSTFMANPRALKTALGGLRRSLEQAKQGAASYGPLGPSSPGTRPVDLRSPVVSAQLESDTRRAVNALARTMGKVAYSTKGHPKWKVLDKGRIPLEPAERAEVMRRKATWHHGHVIPGTGGQRGPSPAVWKSVVKDKTWYTTNTHRAYNVTPSLRGAIGRYHRFIEGTA